MGAIAKPLNIVQTAMMNTISWLENSYSGDCYVLDIDLDTGALLLYGKDSADFRNTFNNIIKRMFNNA